MHGSHAANGVHPRLVELAGLFADCRAALHDVSDQTHWSPMPGSAAAQDLQAFGQIDPTPEAGGWSGFSLFSEVVHTYLLIASGHLGGLAALHASEEVFFPPGMLVRATLENCARAMWVIGSNSAETARNRLARAYLEELLSAEEAKKAAGRLGTKDTEHYQAAAAHFNAVRARVRTVFPEATLETLSNGQLDGQQRLGPEAGVTWMYEFVEEVGGSSITARQATGIYDFLSSCTHPTLYPARQLRDWADHDGHPTSILRLDIGFLERQASAAVLSFYNALSYAMSYFGLPLDRHARLATEIERVLPTVFGEAAHRPEPTAPA